MVHFVWLHSSMFGMFGYYDAHSVIQPFSLHGSDYGLCGQIMDILQPSVCTMISSILAQIGLSGFHQGCFYILAMSEDIVEEMHALLFECFESEVK